MYRHDKSTDADTSEKLLDDNASWTDAKHQPSGSRWIDIIFLILLVACTSVAGLVGFYAGQQDLDKTCTLRISRYSPLVHRVGIEYHEQLFNGSFLKENIFRQEASPEVDAAWESLDRSVRVSPEDALKSGLSPDQVQINEKYGGGYPANVEGLHHLHCLNLLRQALYYNHDYYRALGEGAFRNDDFIVRKHVSHCLDILRQQLMCTVDTGIFGQVWIHKDHPEPFVDFNTAHRCRNFDAIRRWAGDNQLPEVVASDFLRPPASRDVVYDEIP